MRYDRVSWNSVGALGKELPLEQIFAFVDESGNHNLDTSKGGSSNFFIICSVIISEQNLAACYEQAEAIRLQHFQKGEIKSSGLKAKDSERRLRILNQLCQLPFKIYMVVVDKKRLEQDGGLQYKKSFIKYLNGLLYQRLFQNYENLKVLADEHGTPEFQESLKQYITNKYAGDLFKDSLFETKSSKEDVLIQVADFFAGTIAQIYEEKTSTNIINQYKTVVKDLFLGILEWPPKYQSLIPPTMSESEYADYKVYQQALKQADNFTQQLGNTADEDGRLQLCILNYLRFKSEFVGSKEYVSTEELKDHLYSIGFRDHSDQKIRSSGIAKLRDRDVIIASGPKGYKIPQTRADLASFLILASSQIVPFLDRIKKARDVYMLASQGEYDILTSVNLPDLVKLLETLDPLKHSKK